MDLIQSRYNCDAGRGASRHGSARRLAPRFDARTARRYHPAMAVHALLQDLFFRSRIEATAEAAGVPVIVSGTVEELLGKMADAGGGAVLVDLGGGDAGLVGARGGVAAFRP